MTRIKKKPTKTKYELLIEPHIERVRSLVAGGADLKQVADELGINQSTMRGYLDKGRRGDERYKALAEAVDGGTEEAAEAVESALYKLALGYNAQIRKHYKVKRVIYDEETGRRLREEEELQEVYEDVHVPANVTAQKFWLTNRVPERWKDKPEGGGEDEDNGTGIVELPGVVGFGQGGDEQ